jgi:group I intron endonuclease
MIIYITTNLVNGKKYIGRDSNNNPHYYGSGNALKKAIKKYGKSNFKKDIIEICSSIEELCNREKYWIKNFNAVQSKMFYNLDENTYGSTKFNNINKTSQSHKLKKYWENIDPIKKEEFSKNMSLVQSKINQKHTPESIEKIKKNRKTFPENKRKSQGLWEQSKETKTKRSIIMKEKSKKYTDKIKKKIDQYDINGVFIKTWDCIKDIKKQLNIDSGSISNCVNGIRQKTAGGYIWKFHI